MDDDADDDADGEDEEDDDEGEDDEVDGDGEDDEEDEGNDDKVVVGTVTTARLTTNFCITSHTNGIALVLYDPNQLHAAFIDNVLDLSCAPQNGRVTANLMLV